MALISMRQMLDHAAEFGYGVPAFNVNNLEQMRAIMEAADKTDSPVIVQASAGARKYAGAPFLRHLILAAIEEFPHIPVCMHQDHGTSPDVCQRSIQLGFSSVMMDGSLGEDGKTPTDYEYNVRVTQQTVAMAHACGVSVEGELGCLGSLETGMAGEEDGIGAEGVLDHSQMLTDPEEAADFRQENPGRRPGHRHRHQPWRLQVHQATYWRRAGHRPHQGDPQAHPQHPPGDARFFLGTARVAGDHQPVRRRHQRNLRRTG